MVIKKKKASSRAKAKKKTLKSKALGIVTHYYDKINVAVLKLAGPLKVGDYIEFRHGGMTFGQVVESMQINHKNIPQAKKGAEIGLKVMRTVKEGYEAFKAKQPSQNKLSYAPIFPAMKKTQEHKPQISSPAPTPEFTPIPSGPTPKKEKYGDVKFLKF